MVGVQGLASGPKKQECENLLPSCVCYSCLIIKLDAYHFAMLISIDTGSYLQPDARAATVAPILMQLEQNPADRRICHPTFAGDVSEVQKHDLTFWLRNIPPEVLRHLPATPA